VGLTGAQDSSNKNFILSSTVPFGALEMFFINGQLLTYGSDYTVSGTTLSLLSQVPAPSSEDVLKFFCNGVGPTGSITPGYFETNFDGYGNLINPNDVNYFRIPQAGTITSWSIVANGTGPTCTLDVWKVPSGITLPTVSNTIITGTKPGLTQGNAIKSNDVSGWDPGVSANDIFGINVDACTGATKINFLIGVNWT
jgi:hypothetical protein